MDIRYFGQLLGDSAKYPIGILVHFLVIYKSDHSIFWPIFGLFTKYPFDKMAGSVLPHIHNISLLFIYLFF